jgi:hypothetical protein
VGTIVPSLSKSFRTLKKRTNEETGGGEKEQKNVIITSPEFIAAVTLYRDMDTSVSFGKDPSAAIMKKAEINERKIFEVSSEEDDLKEMCDNEVKDDENCGFYFVKYSDEQCKKNLVTRFSAKRIIRDGTIRIRAVIAQSV